MAMYHIAAQCIILHDTTRRDATRRDATRHYATRHYNCTTHYITRLRGIAQVLANTLHYSQWDPTAKVDTSWQKSFVGGTTVGSTATTAPSPSATSLLPAGEATTVRGDEAPMAASSSPTARSATVTGGGAPQPAAPRSPR